MLVVKKVLAANKVDGDESGNKLIEKYGKLSKTRKLSKSRKRLSKSGNLPKFLTPNARIAFNCLWLAFIKALIL